jgi:uncharacterized protein (TIGR01777 family)
MKILISGASGFIGSHLAPFLEGQGHEMIKLVRHENLGSNEIHWHPMKGILDPASVENIDAAIHLSGESIGSLRWTEKKKQAIRDSRVKSTQLLAKTFAKLKHPPKIWLNASAVGFYGNRGNEVLMEESGPGNNFLAEVCREWENAAEEAANMGIRIVFLRFGVVLSKDGGVLKNMLLPFKAGLGGKLGSGQQYMSWVALDDLISAVSFILTDSNLQGPVNVSAPNPVTNAEFTEALGKALNRPAKLGVPAFALKMILGEVADEMLLSSCRAVPQKLNLANYSFAYPDLASAFHSFFNK